MYHADVLFVVSLPVSQLQTVSEGHQCGPGGPPAGHPAGPPGQTGRHSAATVTLLAVSFYLIATTLPVTVCYVLYLGFPEGDPTLTGVEQQTDPTWSRHFIYGSVRAVAEELGMSHYACNFYIYLCTSSVFRRQLIRTLAARFCPNHHTTPPLNNPV